MGCSTIAGEILEQLRVRAGHAVLDANSAQYHRQFEGRGNAPEHRDVREELIVPDGRNALWLGQTVAGLQRKS